MVPGDRRVRHSVTYPAPRCTVAHLLWTERGGENSDPRSIDVQSARRRGAVRRAVRPGGPPAGPKRHLVAAAGRPGHLAWPLSHDRTVDLHRPRALLARPRVALTGDLLRVAHGGGHAAAHFLHRRRGHRGLRRRLGAHGRLDVAAAAAVRGDRAGHARHRNGPAPGPQRSSPAGGRVAHPTAAVQTVAARLPAVGQPARASRAGRRRPRRRTRDRRAVGAASDAPAGDRHRTERTGHVRPPWARR